MFVTVVTPPAFEPVTLAEARRQLRLGEQLDDQTVTQMIPKARGHVEDISAVALASRVVEARFSSVQFLSTGTWQSEPLILPLGHVTAVTSVKYLDSAGAEQTADPATYRVESGQALARVVWVTRPTMLETNDAIRIRYSVGYATAADIPPALIQAVLIVLADLYEMRVPQEATLNTVHALVAPWVLS